MRSPAMSTTCFVSMRPLTLSNRRPGRTPTQRSAGGHCTKLPSGLEQGAGPMNRQGPAAGFRGVVDGACAETSAAHANAPRIVVSTFTRVIRLPSCLLAADDRSCGEQLLLPSALRVVVVHELELAVAELEHGDVGDGADAKRSEILERRHGARRVRRPHADDHAD